jgi:hypothetical protein
MEKIIAAEPFDPQAPNGAAVRVAEKLLEFDL